MQFLADVLLCTVNAMSVLVLLNSSKPAEPANEIILELDFIICLLDCSNSLPLVSL